MQQELDAQFDKLTAEVTALGTGLLRFVAKKMHEDVTQDVLRSGNGLGSPVLSGDFYNNHNVSIGAPDTKTDITVQDGAFFDPSKRAPRPPVAPGSADSVIFSAKAGDTIYITNALPYASMIENEGWSRFKAPDGVYGVAVASVPSFLAATDLKTVISLGAK